MHLTPGHPAKAWWVDSTHGERIYNLPPQLAQFTVPPIQRGIQGLGAPPASADATQAELLLELAARVHDPLASAADKLPDVAKYSRDEYDAFARELDMLFGAENALERAINTATLPLPTAKANEIRSEIDRLAPTVQSFKERVNAAARRGVEGKLTRTALTAVAAGAAAVALGWYVFVHRKRAVRRKR